MNIIESRWQKRLKRCISDMPDTLELLIGQNDIKVAYRGSRDEAMENHGCTDEVEFETSFHTPNVHPDGETL